MTASEIIAKFELYVDDTTELSSSEELDLFNKVYQRVCDDRPWEILKKEATGTMASTTTITMPSDFGFFVDNYSYTDNSISTQINARPVVVWITGSGAASPFQVVNWSDRKQYLNTNGVCYLDIASSLIRFPVAQSSGATYSLDYKAVPAVLAASESPIFPTRFHDIIYHGMCVDDMTIQLFDKARSYAGENQAQYNSYLKQMALWNANLLLN